MANELKPCPFCGAFGEELGICIDIDAGGSARRIQCYSCNVEAPFYPSEDQAIDAWNTRSKTAQQDAPTDPELEQSIYETAGVFVKQPGEPAEFHCRRDDLPKIARAILDRYSPAHDAEEDSYVIDRMSKLLAGVAVALKGPEKARHRHGYQDLPKLAAQVMAELQKLRQDAERERDKERLDWFDANCKRESSMRFGEEFKPVFAWAIACDPQPGATVRDAIDGIMDAARAQRAGKEGA